MKTIFNRYYLLLLLLFGTTTLYAQSIEQKADSILLLIKQSNKTDTNTIDQYNALTNLYLFNNPAISLKYAQKALQIAKQKKYDQTIADTYGNIFLCHFYLGSNADSLFKYVQLFEKEMMKNKEKANMVKPYWAYAMYYGNIGKPDKEIEYYLKALDIIKKYDPSPDQEAKLLGNIAGVFESKGQVMEALKYYQKVLTTIEDNFSKGNTLVSIGNIYSEELNKKDSAQIFFTEALKFYELENSLNGIANVIMHQAKYQDDLKHFEQAEKLLFKASKIITDNNFGSILHTLYGGFSKHYFLLKKYNLAIEYGEKAIKEIEIQENYYMVDEIYDYLHESYAKIGEYKKAYEIRCSLANLQDSISNTHLLTKIETLKTEFQVSQKETENKLLKAETEVAKKQTRNRTFTTIGLGIILLLLVGWSSFIYKANQEKKKTNEILEIKVQERTKELEQANYELRTFNYIASHDIKEPIRVIAGYAGLIFKKLPSDLKESLGEYFDTIKRSTNQLYTLIEDFASYTTMSKSETIEKQAVDLNLLTSNIVNNLQETIKKYNGTIEFSDLPIIQSSNSLLFTTLKNLVENGLKYNQSENPTVNINYKKNEAHHQIIVSDNGIGIDKLYHEKIFEIFKRLHNRETYEGSGIGLAIVKLSVEKLGGTIELESETGKGSRFIIELPL